MVHILYFYDNINRIISKYINNNEQRENESALLPLQEGRYTCFTSKEVLRSKKTYPPTVFLLSVFSLFTHISVLSIYDFSEILKCRIIINISFVFIRFSNLTVLLILKPLLNSVKGFF